MKPLFSYPGQKSWLAPRFKELFPSYAQLELVELFGGSAALSFTLDKALVFYNETLTPIVKLLTDVALATERVHQQLHSKPAFFEDPENIFYWHRMQFNRNRKTGEFASGHLLHVALRGFNSTLRFNQAGDCNTPYRKVKTPRSLHGQAELLNYSNLICNWQFQNRFAESLIEPVSMIDDRIYFADPPYAGSATTYGTKWQPNDTRELLHQLYLSKSLFMVSSEVNETYIGMAEHLGLSYELIESGRKYQQKTGTSEKPKELLIYRNS